MKPADVKSNTSIDSSEKVNNKDRKCKIGDIVRILKYKNISAKGYTPNQSGEVFVLCCGHTLLVILTEKKLLEHSAKKNFKNQIKKSLELKQQSSEKAINYMLNGKNRIIRLIDGQIKKAII